MENQMNTKKSPIVPVIIVLALIALALVVYAVNRKDTDDAMMKDTDTMQEDAMMTDEKATDDSMMGGTMLEGSEQPDNGMVGGDAMAPKDDAMMKEDTAMMEDGKSGDSMMEGDAMMKSAGSYEAYSPEKLAWANSGNVVLFFRASWCPTCRTLDASLKANDIPEGLYILDVDYDTATELKKKYGVTSQHTLVQVDADGNKITSWLGGSSAADIAAKVQ